MGSIYPETPDKLVEFKSRELERRGGGGMEVEGGGGEEEREKRLTEVLQGRSRSL